MMRMGLNARIYGSGRHCLFDMLAIAKAVMSQYSTLASIFSFEIDVKYVLIHFDALACIRMG